jgi:hypothetical protein
MSTPHHEHDVTDDALDALLRAGDAAVPAPAVAPLAAAILERAQLPLARRRRSARGSAEDALAGWGRYLVPAATAAAIIAMLSVSRIELSTESPVAGDGARGDSSALLQALHDDGASLALHLTTSDDASVLPSTSSQP